MRTPRDIAACLCLVLLAHRSATVAAAVASDGLIDTVRLGDGPSETAHDLRPDHAAVIRGGLGEPARQLLPIDPSNWEGGRLSCSVGVDPDRANYLTVRFWGDDVTPNRLVLFCEGKQVGYHHLGDVDTLDFGTEAPVYNGRFYYVTTPLPVGMTRGRSRVRIEVRSMGPIWGYGSTFAQYQKPMTQPSRGVYALYTHTDGCFTPPPAERQGTAPVGPVVRSSPGIEVIDRVKQRVNRELEALLTSSKPLNQVQIHLLARAYHTSWTIAHGNGQVVEQVERACDALFVAYHADPALAESDPAVYNGGWFGMGMAGDAVRLLAGALGPRLDYRIPDPAAGGVTRRTGWSQMLQASRDWHRRHRRMYTNQSMITDLNVYRANRGVAAIDPAHALPEDQVRQYLYESIGLQPWLGSDTDHGPDHAAGDNYFLLTRQGLSKELGYVGTYGEVLDWVTQIYDATRDPGQLGDARIEKQLEKIANARAVFRYPMVDEQGNRAMRMETVVGWRDAHLPGDVTYGERPTWDASALYTAAATLDPAGVAYAQQMFADNQFFASVADGLEGSGLRVTAGLLGVPGQYAALSARPPSPARLPMTAGQPDTVWADEDDGVLAVKHGDDILYVSTYWRARYAVNFLARVHDIRPAFSRVATVRESAEYEPSGQTYTRRDWIDMGFGGGGHKYPGDLHSALAGERLPIARIPAGTPFKPGDENPYAGRATFYTVRYGDYLIGMNCTDDRSFDLAFPAGTPSVRNLATGATLTMAGPVTVGPHSTAVLWLGR